LVALLTINNATKRRCLEQRNSIGYATPSRGNNGLGLRAVSSGGSLNSEEKKKEVSGINGAHYPSCGSFSHNTNKNESIFWPRIAHSPSFEYCCRICSS